MHKWELLQTFAAFLLLSGAALAAEPVQAVTIGEISAHIGQYHGKPVRVHGFINQCTQRVCLICDGPVYAQKSCANIAVWRDYLAGEVLDRVYSFTEVVLEGKGFEGYYWDPVVEIDCFGLRSCTEGIIEANVVELVSRRAVTTLAASERGEILPLLQQAAEKKVDIADPAMLAVFAKDPRYSARIKDHPDHYVAFAVPGKEYGMAVTRGYMCWGRGGGDNKAPQPLRENDLEWDSFANTYICARAIKRGNADWEITGHDPHFE